MPPRAKPAAKKSGQTSLTVERIKHEYSGLVTVQRKVPVQVPGKMFAGLTAAEQKEFYWCTPVETTERHKFRDMHKGWGLGHTGGKTKTI